MPHMVIFRSSEGKPGYHQAEALDEAVRFVEHLRNQEQVSDARIFSMQEVPIEFKTYYKVEVGGAPAPVPAAAEEPPVAEPEAAPPAEAVQEGSDEMAGAGLAAANARFGRFNRS